MKNKLLFSILSVLSLCLLAGVASALTWNSPDDNAAVNGTLVFKWTPAIASIYSCNLSTTTDGVFYTNSTANLSNYNVSNNTALLTDAHDTTVTATCTNITTIETASITLTIDNTAPTCSFTLDKANIEVFKELTVNALGTTDNLAGTLTYVYNLTKGDDTVVSDSDTDGSNVFDTSDTDQLGENTIIVRVIDETGNQDACSSQTVMIVGSDEGGGGGGFGIITIDESKVPVFVLMGTIIFVVIIVVIVVIINSKPKRRKR